MNNAAADSAPAVGLRDWIPVALGLAISVAALWLVTGQGLVVLGFAGGVVALAGAAWALTRSRAPLAQSDWAMPDWSVTVSAIERADAAVAIADRAGRLVCANQRFLDWYGAVQGPARIPVDEPSLQRLAQAQRAAWRDGEGATDLVESEAGRWRAEVARAGRGEDHLVWRFFPLLAADPVNDLVQALDGKLGRALALAGMSAAIVDPDGQIRAATQGFALRATGDGLAAMAGRDFVALLRQDEQDRLFWARDARKAAPLTMYYLPIADPDAPG